MRRPCAVADAAPQACPPGGTGLYDLHGKIKPEQTDDGADQTFGLAHGQAEPGQKRGCDQDRQGQITRLPARDCARRGPPALNGFVGEPRLRVTLPATCACSSVESCLHLDQASPLALFTTDGAYDQDGVHGEVARHSAGAAVIVPPRSSAVPSDTTRAAPTQRDRHLGMISEHGRRRWQKASGCPWRALVKADISRFRRVVGDGLRSRTDHRR